MDILITQPAKIELDKLLINNEEKSFRIVARRDSIYEDATFEIALGNATESDDVYDIDGYKVIISSNISCYINFITISYGGLFSRDQFSIECDFGLFRY